MSDASTDLFARTSELIEHAGRLPDPSARELAQDLVASVLEIHRIALERAVKAAPDAWIELAKDPVVANVLLLHGLHPTPLETRVRDALSAIAGAQLSAIDDGIARIGVRSKHGLDRARADIEKALTNAAPDLGGWIVEEIETLVPAVHLLREGRA